MITIRLLSLLAFVISISVIPLAQSGRFVVAVLLAPLGLLAATLLLIEWKKQSSDNTERFGGQWAFRLLLMLFSGLTAVAIYAVFFELPDQITNPCRYLIEKLFYVYNRARLFLGLYDLMPRHVWARLVEVMFWALALAFVLWALRLKLTNHRLLLLGLHVVVALTLGMAAPSAEFQISSSVPSAQFAFDVSADTRGNFVVAWQSKDQDGSGWGVYARIFDPEGTPLGDEFQVNTYILENQFVPRVAMHNEGGFAITWESKGQDGSSYGIYCRLYDPEGVPLGVEFQVNTTTIDSQHDPSITMTPAGDFVIVWVSDGQDGSFGGIYGQRFDASGNRRGSEFQVNTFTAGKQLKPAVSSDANGNFAVVWESEDTDGTGKNVYFRRYDSAGMPLGNEFQVNAFTAGDQYDTWINMRPAGDFIVTWSSREQDGDGLGVFGKRFDTEGRPLENEFRVNNFVAGDQRQSSVSSDLNGNYVIVWESERQDGNGKGIYGQNYDAGGTPVGNEFQVNIYVTNDQSGPIVTHHSFDKFIVVWTSVGQDGSAEGVYGRIY